uniref:Uncharacterized protein n=1 Tax=Dulem virus 31 TaxID=3145749 RepID=A0AAU8AW86_9VIRU
MKFSDLKFTKKEGSDVIQALVFFPNGYGASIIRGSGCYTSDNVEDYELAVLDGDKFLWKICYKNPLNRGINCFLSPESVEMLLDEIEKWEKI